jgi:Abnormal spindle-like microcephaly-assoc'd, ASPM-SPD-2-Hydin
LSGIGLTSGANATLSPTSLNFSSQSVGTVSSPLSVTLSNYGTATLNSESIAATADFGETNSCGASLASGGSCPINVTFTPNATGSVTGTLS